MTDKTIAFSLLDLAPIPEGSSAREAFSHSLDLARLAEKRGYHRYWLAEHHNMTGIASAATSVLIGYLAANTTTLHLGSGGVMLPNHSPLVIAEQFGTLNTLYPGRIDLGLGRAPGSDQRTMMALRRHMSGDIDNFPAMWRSWWTGLTPAIPIRMCARYQAMARKSRVVVRLQPLQRATGGAAWSAVCVCLTLRAGYAVPGAASLSQQLQTVSTAGKTIRDGVHQYYRRRQQPRR